MPLVALPVLEQVVGGDVGAVAHRRERGRASARSPSSIKARPRAPLWEMKPTFPGGGIRGAKVAFSQVPSPVLTMPRQLGPISRIPRPGRPRAARAAARRPRADLAEPGGDDHERLDTGGPAVLGYVHDIGPAGTAITARSTASGSEATLG